MRKKEKLRQPQKRNATTWQPGQSGNPAGRPVGSKNAWTKAVSLYVQHVLTRYFKGEIPEIKQTFEQDLAALTESERVRAVLKMIQMEKPAVKQVPKSTEADIKISVAYKPSNISKADEIIPIEVKPKSDDMNE